MQNNSLIPMIGITGGIGSGKSIICRIFSCLGIPVFYSDEVAKKLIHYNPTIKNGILSLFGKEAYDLNGAYQSIIVRQKILENPLLREALNQLIHPAVRAEAIRFQEQLKPSTPFALYESALITPNTKPAFISKIIQVQCDKNTRVNRLIQRQLSPQEALQLIELQEKNYPASEKADYLIQNNDSDKILPQVFEIFDSLKSTY